MKLMLAEVTQMMLDYYPSSPPVYSLTIKFPIQLVNAQTRLFFNSAAARQMQCTVNNLIEKRSIIDSGLVNVQTWMDYVFN